MLWVDRDGYRAWILFHIAKGKFPGARLTSRIDYTGLTPLYIIRVKGLTYIEENSLLTHAKSEG